MEMKKSLGLFFLVLIAVLASQVVVQTEGRECKSRSQGFKGLCFSDHNCALICRDEGFTAGKCQGLLRRTCFCTKIC